MQISDSHVGFDKPANPNALGTLEEAVGRINALPAKPAFMIHTGDISHLSKVSEFDDADRIISQTRLTCTFPASTISDPLSQTTGATKLAEDSFDARALSTCQR